MDQYVVKQWLEQWRQCAELADDDVPSTLYNDLVEPLRKGDPVFSSDISREMIKPPISDQISHILSASRHSKKRLLVCEMIFNICKCTSHECRMFVASQLPLLLWTEYALDREDKTMEEDWSAIEVTLLAAFQQDLNIESSVPQIRVPDIKNESSIYHDVKEIEGNHGRFPFKTGSEKVIKPDVSMYPSRPISKIDEYTRPIVFYRLCRFLQDNMNALPSASKLAYCILIERLATVGTPLCSPDASECLQKLALNTQPSLIPDNESMLSLVDYKMKEVSLSPMTQTGCYDNVDFEWIIRLFDTSQYSAHMRRLPASTPLYLLWADALAALSFQFLALSKIVQKQLLRRSRYELLPLAVLALS